MIVFLDQIIGDYFIFVLQEKAEWTTFNALVKSSAEARSKARAMANKDASTPGELLLLLRSLQVPLRAYPLKTLLKSKTKTIVRLRNAVLDKNIRKIRHMAEYFIRIVSALHDKQISV